MPDQLTGALGRAQHREYRQALRREIVDYAASGLSRQVEAIVLRVETTGNTRDQSGRLVPAAAEREAAHAWKERKHRHKDMANTPVAGRDRHRLVVLGRFLAQPIQIPRDKNDLDGGKAELPPLELRTSEIMREIEGY